MGVWVKKQCYYYYYFLALIRTFLFSRQTGIRAKRFILKINKYIYIKMENVIPLNVFFVSFSVARTKKDSSLRTLLA